MVWKSNLQIVDSMFLPFTIHDYAGIFSRQPRPKRPDFVGCRVGCQQKTFSPLASQPPICFLPVHQQVLDDYTGLKAPSARLLHPFAALYLSVTP